MANPPKPIEVKRRTGNPGKRPLPDRATVVSLPQAVGVPDPPVTFGAEGMDLWRAAWTAGAVWISPATDMFEVIEACHAADDVARCRRRHQATCDPADMRAVATASKMLTEALSALGFNPTARARLGVAEVRARTKLEELRANAAKRETSG